jgi:micrococcal nuclease
MKCFPIALGVVALASVACSPAEPALAVKDRVATDVAGTMTAFAARVPPATETRQPTDSPHPTDTTPPTNSPLPSDTYTAEASRTPAPTLPPTISPGVDGIDCIPAHTQRDVAQVVSITDGDTIRVDIHGATYRLRYIGMDTPETGQPFADAATAKNRALVEGKTVLLIKDVSETDIYDRLLRYVVADGVFVNHELVRQGFAQILTYPPDVACSATFLGAQQAAREEGKGLWAATPKAKPAATPEPTTCDPSYPTVCIPPPPPDLDCGDISYRRFTVLPPDPHHFDGDTDGIGCESG